jgi:hypothetical protein
MFGTDSSQLLRRVVAGTPGCRERSERRSPLRPEHFPVQADGRDIVAQDGTVIAVAGDAAMSEEIVRRLNKTDWNDQEDQWAL